MLMLRNSLAVLCVAGLLGSPVLAQSDKPDIVEETAAYRLEANIPDLPQNDPKLSHLVRADLARQLAAYRKDAETEKKQADAEKYQFRQYELTVNWALELDHPKFLSLINFTWIYSGGAHGNSTFKTLTWDRAKQSTLKLDDLFADAAAAKGARKAIQVYVIKDILRQKAENQKVPVESFTDEQVTSGVTGAFPAFTLNASDQAGKIGGLHMWYPPYAVGAYAEGSFESRVPQEVFSHFLRDELKPVFGGKPVDQPAQ